MSGKSQVPVAAPKTLRYEQDAGLPVAIDAKSSRHFHTPINGQVFKPEGTNQIRIHINSDNFVDFSHSYLSFRFLNTSQAGTCGLDYGVPFFRRLQVLSGGEVLEDINEYSRLVAMLSGIQGNRLNQDEQSITEHRRAPTQAAQAAAADPVANGDAVNDAGEDLTDARVAVGVNVTQAIKNAVNTAIDNVNARTTAGATITPYVHKAHNDIAAGGAGDGRVHATAGAIRTFNVPIVSALFNLDKYFPMLLCKSGIELIFTLNPAIDIGTWTGGNPFYAIDQVKYIAHEVALNSGFVQQMKQSMESTGGLLMMSGTTYQHFLNNQVGMSGTHTHTVSARVRSLKGLLVRPQLESVNNKATTYCISTGNNCAIHEAQFRIGNQTYPQTPMVYRENNKGEFYQEVRKCFGTIGSVTHGSNLNDLTYRSINFARGDNLANFLTDNEPRTGGSLQLWTMAYDTESFSKSATESGLNTVDDSLTCQFEVKCDGEGCSNATHFGNAATANVAVRYDTFAMSDCVFYIDVLGRVTTQI